MRIFIKRWGCLSMVLGFVLVAGVFYWGWCWGWWGKGNLFMQYLFQCNCPHASEESRYHPFKVLVSACISPQLADISPSRRYVLVVETGPEESGLVRGARVIELGAGTNKLIDLQEHITLPRQLGFRILDDSLVLVLNTLQGHEANLVDLDDNSWTTVSIIRDSAPTANDFVTLQNAKRIIWFESGLILSVAESYKDQENLLIYGSRELQNQVLQQLTDMGTKYETRRDELVFEQFHPTLSSSDGQLFANSGGIYLVQTNQLLVATQQTYFGARLWIRDDQAVLYSVLGVVPLVRGNGLVPSFFPVPQPILLLEVPPEY